MFSSRNRKGGGEGDGPHTTATRFAFRTARATWWMSRPLRSFVEGVMVVGSWRLFEVVALREEAKAEEEGAGVVLVVVLVVWVGRMWVGKAGSWEGRRGSS